MHRSYSMYARLAALTTFTVMLSLVAILYVAHNGTHHTLNPTRLWKQACKCQSSPSPINMQQFFHDILNPKHPDPSSLLQDSRQIIEIDQGNSFALISSPNEETRSYGVSMFHQLHCLEMLRGAVHKRQHESHQHGSREVTRGRLEAPEHVLKADKPISVAEHLDHCLDYLSQGVMCSADDTLEPSFDGVLETGEKVIVIDGVGTYHQCKSAEGLHKVMLQSQKKPLVVTRGLEVGDTLGGILKDAKFND